MTHVFLHKETGELCTGHRSAILWYIIGPKGFWLFYDRTWQQYFEDLGEL